MFYAQETNLPVTRHATPQTESCLALVTYMYMQDGSVNWGLPILGITRLQMDQFGLESKRKVSSFRHKEVRVTRLQEPAKSPRKSNTVNTMHSK